MMYSHAPGLSAVEITPIGVMLAAPDITKQPALQPQCYVRP
jgi:hypothetical protein